MQPELFARILALFNAGSRRAARMAMTEITVRSSMIVNLFFLIFYPFLFS